ncbi:hypothetical protein [Conchiformibius steedae]|uniref:Lipoprotein n=1 Tax=Conchiformibius steedae TaxID=153493 RepID=A0A3P2A613_9NEIS|nr:hypothetical protein [Conchiformibius steedae]RRD90425.1 hypothetical protein EII21_05770 [Conchiformibius steedae]
MKKVVTLILVGFIGMNGCAAMEQEFQNKIKAAETPIFDSKFDKFTGGKKVAWSKFHYSNLDLAGKSFDKNFAITTNPKTGKWISSIILMMPSKNHRYLKCHNTDWLVDGKAIKPIAVLYDSEIRRRPTVHAHEVLTIGFNKESMEALSKASTIEYRVCNDEHTMTDEERSGLKRVYDEAVKP